MERHVSASEMGLLIRREVRIEPLTGLQRELSATQQPTKGNRQRSGPVGALTRPRAEESVESLGQILRSHPPPLAGRGLSNQPANPAEEIIDR